MGEVCGLLAEVTELPLEGLDAKATDLRSEGTLRSGTRMSSWGASLAKSQPSGHAKLCNPNQLEEPAKLEAALPCRSGNGSPFSPLPRPLPCFGPSSASSVCPAHSPSPRTRLLVPSFLEALPFSPPAPAAAQASPDPLAAAAAAATIWPLGSPSLQAILKDAGGEALAGSVGEPGSDRKAGCAAVPPAGSDLHARLRSSPGVNAALRAELEGYF